jgi:hypothetical protein
MDPIGLGCEHKQVAVVIAGDTNGHAVCSYLLHERHFVLSVIVLITQHLSRTTVCNVNNSSPIDQVRVLILNAVSFNMKMTHISCSHVANAIEEPNRGLIVHENTGMSTDTYCIWCQNNTLEVDDAQQFEIAAVDPECFCQSFTVVVR